MLGWGMPRPLNYQSFGLSFVSGYGRGGGGVGVHRKGRLKKQVSGEPEAGEGGKWEQGE